MTNNNTLEFTDSNFQSEVLSAQGVVLVDFWAPWCGPCRTVGPIVDELANDFKGKIKIGKVNTDDSPKVSTDFEIRSIPTLIIFKDGKVSDTIVGVLPKEQLAAKLTDVLG